MHRELLELTVLGRLLPEKLEGVNADAETARTATIEERNIIFKNSF